MVNASALVTRVRTSFEEEEAACTWQRKEESVGEAGAVGPAGAGAAEAAAMNRAEAVNGAGA